MKKSGMKATTLTTILIVLIFLVIGAVIVANWQLKSMLSSEVSRTNTLKQQASDSSNNLTKAKTLQTYMQNHDEEVKKAASIVADSKTYKYQNQIIEDVTRYANSVGLQILEFNFPENQSTTKNTKNALKSITAEITFVTPVDYQNYLRFLKLIEQNLTKMQIISIGAAPDNDSKTLIDSQPIELEVYVN